MPEVLGRIVLKSKPYLSLDCGQPLGHTVLMAESETELEYKQGFTGRVAEARERIGWKQWQVAEALGMPQDRYKQYEKRTLLPHHLIGRFCLITRVDPEWLLTGRGKRPLKPLEVVAETRPARAKPRKARAKRVA